MYDLLPESNQFTGQPHKLQTAVPQSNSASLHEGSRNKRKTYLWCEHVVKKGCVFLKLWKSGQICKFPGDIVLQIQ